MEERAHITSVEALESFRASLIVYLAKARPALEEVTTEMQRLRTWLEHDHRVECERIKRRQMIKLEQARQALASAQYSNPQGGADEERMAVRRARHAMEETEMKLRKAKVWSRDFDSQVDPLTRQLDHLLNLLTTDLKKGAASLARTIRTLSDYTGSPLPDAASGPESSAANASPSPSTESAS